MRRAGRARVSLAEGDEPEGLINAARAFRHHSSTSGRWLRVDDSPTLRLQLRWAGTLGDWIIGIFGSGGAQASRTSRSSPFGAHEAECS